MKNNFNFLNSINKNKIYISNNLSNSKKNFFVSTFIKDLEKQIKKIHSNKLLSNLKPYSLLTFAKFDDNYAICFDYEKKQIYYIPKNKIKGNMPLPGEALKLTINNDFYVDYSAILADEQKIEHYLNECNFF